MTKWSEASQEVLNIAQDMIGQYHPDLVDASIGFLFRDKAGTSGNKMVLGHAEKVSDRLRPYLDYDFIIWLSEEDFIAMTEERKEAIIDHELCHITITEDGDRKMVRHDVEEFTAIIERHGLWNWDLIEMGDQVKQLALPLDNTKIEMSTSTGHVATITGDQLTKLADSMERANDDSAY